MLPDIPLPPDHHLTTPDRERNMVTIRHHLNGTPAVWCDPEIADLVDALNNGALATIASCSGHGESPFGSIILSDGRELLVFQDRETSRRAASILINAARQESKGGEA
ncbi:hypothetical protein [Orrella dioscoreae]|uniref:hypothetical protein n=1 Tax=Orrella dioscoreae TaxID=1851544 RepID=UPI000BF1E6A1|nr:hypothetical protein [Orrella dioscoreae]